MQAETYAPTNHSHQSGISASLAAGSKLIHVTAERRQSIRSVHSSDQNSLCCQQNRLSPGSHSGHQKPLLLMSAHNSHESWDSRLLETTSKLRKPSSMFWGLFVEWRRLSVSNPTLTELKGCRSFRLTNPVLPQSPWNRIQNGTGLYSSISILCYFLPLIHDIYLTAVVTLQIKILWMKLQQFIQVQLKPSVH